MHGSSSHWTGIIISFIFPNAKYKDNYDIKGNLPSEEVYSMLGNTQSASVQLRSCCLSDICMGVAHTASYSRVVTKPKAAT